MKKNISRITFIVQQNEILKRADSFICGISGGQDSILLLFIIYHLKKLFSLNFTLIYCNHLWQLQNFDTLSQLLKLVYLLNLSVNISIPNRRLISEKNGHVWRQKNFVQVANFYNKNKLVVGHTCTDQLETSIWHFLRGTSPIGLVSLKPTSLLSVQKSQKKLNPITSYHTRKRKTVFISKQSFVWKKYFLKTQSLKVRLNIINKQTKFFQLKVLTSNNKKYKNNIFLVKQTNPFYYSYCLLENTSKKLVLNRPLLNFYRTTTAKIIKTNNLPVVIDVTNQSKKVTRNKIRLIFFPLVKYYIQTQAGLNIKKYLNITEIEQNYLDHLTFDIFKFHLINPVKIRTINNMSLAIQRLSIRKILEIYSSKQIKTNYIEQILEKIPLN